MSHVEVAMLVALNAPQAVQHALTHTTSQDATLLVAALGQCIMPCKGVVHPGPCLLSRTVNAASCAIMYVVFRV